MGTHGTTLRTNTGMANRVVVWLRNDLRIHDNELFHRAKQLMAKGTLPAGGVVFFYAFDPRHFGTTEWGSRKTGLFRAKFLIETVSDLQQNLRKLGSDLIVRYGKPERLIGEVLTVGAPKQPTGGQVWFQQETTSEELLVEKRVAASAAAAGATCSSIWGSTMYHLDDLPYNNPSNLPGSFTPFKEKCERNISVRPCFPVTYDSLPPPPSEVADTSTPVPSLVDLGFSLEEASQAPDPRACLAFKGGETAALARVKQYFWDSDCVASYFDTRNGMIGGDYSTKFSPWLSNGALSPRYVHAEVDRYQATPGKANNKSTYWVKFELTWRDCLRFWSLKWGNSMFHLHGPAGAAESKKTGRPSGGRQWSSDMSKFSRWKEGRTGHPLVDANMRELAATGFMSNRGRQNVASYLCHDLGLDWRLGADWFETLLLDHDPCSNWGNWASAAGVTGGRLNVFNIVKQSKDYDLEGQYARLWLPELAKVPGHLIHQPWLMSLKDQEAAGVSIGRDYPAPEKSVRPQWGGGGHGMSPEQPGSRRKAGKDRNNNRRNKMRPGGDWEVLKQ